MEAYLTTSIEPIEVVLRSRGAEHRARRRRGKGGRARCGRARRRRLCGFADPAPAADDELTAALIAALSCDTAAVEGGARQRDVASPRRRRTRSSTG